VVGGTKAVADLTIPSANNKVDEALTSFMVDDDDDFCFVAIAE
jgi:hypothetical protein